jgi:hypothetical protein
MDESAATVIAKYAPAILARSASETVFWTGAGTSADLPTSAPVGFALTDRALGLCFAGSTLDVMQRYYASLRMARSRPRLETVLDVVRQVHGVRVLADLLSDLRSPTPNGLHQFFAVMSLLISILALRRPLLMPVFLSFIFTVRSLMILVETASGRPWSVSSEAFPLISPHP